MKVPSLRELAIQTVDTPDEMLVQLAADYKQRAKENQQYADRFSKLVRQRKRAKRRGVALQV
ncbi:hypothetical protein [Bradyrhizobium sp. 613_E4_N2_2]|uniref:hypothetical protein n=1 Tax=Bradyrhizobium sp. 613_E4_N2_2 TaxID=3240371 RepID=UPI003F891494